jgi:hypothetical protein
MPRFVPMEKHGIDDESECLGTMEDEPADNDLDADFNDDSDFIQKPASKPSLGSASKVGVNNLEVPMGSGFENVPPALVSSDY